MWESPWMGLRSQKKCTKLLITTELISTRHDCLSFAPGCAAKVWALSFGFFISKKVPKLLSKQEFGPSGRHKWHHKKHSMSDEKENQHYCEGRLQLLLIPPAPLNAAIMINQNIHSIFYWYHPYNGILLIVVQQEDVRELHDSIVDWVQCDLANIILNTLFQAHCYYQYAHHHHHAVQQSHKSEPVNPSSSLREATQVEHIGQICVTLITCIHIFLKLNKGFLNCHKPSLVFANATKLRHHPFARTHSSLIWPTCSYMATTTASVTIINTGIVTFIIALLWVSIILVPQMSLHEHLLGAACVGGEMVDQHIINMEGALLGRVM